MKDTVEILLIRFNLKEIEDKAIELVKKNTHYPYKLTIYDNYQKKQSLSVVWNRLCRTSKCKYVCLLNSDSYVTEGWLTEIMRHFKDDVAAVGPSGDKVGSIQKSYPTPELAAPYIGHTKEVDTLSGFCIVIRNDLEIKFPREVPFYGGESAWCEQARRKGYKLLWAQGSFVRHLRAKSARKEGNFDKLRTEGLIQWSKWLAKTSPVLFITYDRIAYTKKSLKALLRSGCKIIIIDNNSTDGTKSWLKEQTHKNIIKIIYSDTNLGVTGSMQKFFELTKNDKYIGKVDNDTIVPKDWFWKIIHEMESKGLDIVQAKHHILHGNIETFEQWKNLSKTSGEIFRSGFVGGSGIVVRRSVIVDPLPTNKWLGGWTRYQVSRPEIKKAFHCGVEIKLLDMKADNKPDYSKYPNYYRKVGRLKSGQVEEKNIVLSTKKTIDKLNKKIQEKKRYAFLRFGDGELLTIGDSSFEGKEVVQFVCASLRNEMEESFCIDHPDYMIAQSAGMIDEEGMEKGLFAQFEWNDRLDKIVNQYYVKNIFYNPIAFHYSMVFKPLILKRLFDLLEDKKVALVGGPHLRGLRKPLTINKFVYTPITQSYDSIDIWYPVLEDVARKMDVILFATGYSSNVAQKRLWSSEIEVGTIDIGSVATAIISWKSDQHTWMRMGKERITKFNKMMGML